MITSAGFSLNEWILRIGLNCEMPMRIANKCYMMEKLIHDQDYTIIMCIFPTQYNWKILLYLQVIS